MSGPLSGGLPLLDEILGGGLPGNSVAVITGPPGAGKTILAQQYVFANATPARPAVYLSTVSEPLEKLLRFGQSLSFFDPRAVGERVFYEDLGGQLYEGGLDAALESVDRLIKERRPGLLVIDSFKALSAFGADGRAFRAFLHALAGRLGAFPISCLWVGEHTVEEVPAAPEFAVADAIIQLSIEREAQREVRYLEVLKLRGRGYRTGKHAYRITADGLRVFPRLADRDGADTAQVPAVRVSSGLAALDGLLGDGYWAGSSTLMAGPAGSGKTLAGLHFILAGATSGESGVFATFQELPAQLERVAGSFGWTLDRERVEVMYRSPVDLYMEEWFYDLLETVERVGARRVVVDSLGDLRITASDELRFREYLHTLIQRCWARGISLMMTLEVPDLFGAGRISDAGVSNLADNVVLLQFARDGARVRRVVTVLKTRASDHDERIHEFAIRAGEGVVLGEPVVAGADARGPAATSRRRSWASLWPDG